MEIHALRTLTAELLQYNDHATKRYSQCRETGEQGDFYKEVKPFADKVKDAVEKWEKEATDWIIQNKPKHLYPIQIKNTAENLQMVSVQAFYPKTSLSRFNHHVQSIDYILRALLEVLDE